MAYFLKTVLSRPPRALLRSALPLTINDNPISFSYTSQMLNPPTSRPTSETKSGRRGTVPVSNLRSILYSSSTARLPTISRRLVPPYRECNILFITNILILRLWDIKVPERSVQMRQHTCDIHAKSSGGRLKLQPVSTYGSL